MNTVNQPSTTAPTTIEASLSSCSCDFPYAHRKSPSRRAIGRSSKAFSNACKSLEMSINFPVRLHCTKSALVPCRLPQEEKPRPLGSSGKPLTMTGGPFFRYPIINPIELRLVGNVAGVFPRYWLTDWQEFGITTARLRYPLFLPHLPRLPAGQVAFLPRHDTPWMDGVEEVESYCHWDGVENVLVRLVVWNG